MSEVKIIGELIEDVPLAICDNNAFEISIEPNEPEFEVLGADCNLDWYMNWHVFKARRKAEGRLEILGANEVLNLARAQGVTQIGVVSVADLTDEEWMVHTHFEIICGRGYNIESLVRLWDAAEQIRQLDKFRELLVQHAKIRIQNMEKNSEPWSSMQRNPFIFQETVERIKTLRLPKETIHQLLVLRKGDATVERVTSIYEIHKVVSDIYERQKREVLKEK